MVAQTARRRPTVARPAKGRHPRQDSKQEGARFDKTWRRRNAPTFREIGNAELLRAIQWVASRSLARKRGTQKWGDNDQSTTDETKARSWAFGEVQALRYHRKPAWLDEVELPARRASPYGDFLGLLILAYRAGAVGVVLSYEEAMALLKVGSRSTWRRWTVELETLGLIRIVQLWKVGDDGNPCYDRLLYRVGPALEELGGPALLEDADEPHGSALNRWRRKIAAGLRRRAAERRRARKGELWQRCRGNRADAGGSDGAAEPEAEGGQVPEDGAPRPLQAEPEPQSEDAPESVDPVFWAELEGWTPGQPVADLGRAEEPQDASQQPQERDHEAPAAANGGEDDAVQGYDVVVELQQLHKWTPLYRPSGVNHAGPRGPGKIERHDRLSAVTLHAPDLPPDQTQPSNPALPPPLGSDVEAPEPDAGIGSRPEQRRPDETPTKRLRSSAPDRSRRRTTPSLAGSADHDDHAVWVTCPTCKGGGGVGPTPCSTCDGDCVVRSPARNASTTNAGCAWCDGDDPSCTECDGEEAVRDDGDAE